MMEWGQITWGVVRWAGFSLAGVLCVTGIVLSALSLSGTWLVVAAGALAAWLSGAGFPGWGWVLGWVLVCGLIELVEFGAGYWGVKRRGGSALAGFAAVVGALLGAVAGVWIPVPLLGPFLGMLAGGFALAYAVERLRLKVNGRAAHIATGTVLARISMLLLKVAAATTMTIWLIAGLIFGRG